VVSNEQRLRAQLERALQQERTLLELAALGEQPLTGRLRVILQQAARTMEIGRVSFWSFRDAPPAIHCDELYRAASGDFERGAVLAASDYPRYFDALATGKPIIARDAHRDARTSEFSPGYLTPIGIGAMLDVPVYVRGRLAGVVCNEHVGGERDWTADEQIFAMAVGQQVALAIEAQHRASAEEELRDSEGRFRTMVEAAPIPMLVTSYPDGICLYANEEAARLTGLPRDEIVGRATPDYYVDPEVREELVAELERAGAVSGREVRLRRADGSVYWALVSIRVLTFGGRPAAIAGLWDMSGQKQLQERLQHLALHDPLTGLPNRAYFFDLLRSELTRAQRDADHRFAVLFIDIDGFKQINDTLGHDTGDAVLVEAAARLKACLRATDTAARLGGDEFTVLLVRPADADHAQRVADRIAAALATPLPFLQAPLTLSASIGLVMADPLALTPGDLVRRADAAMYRVKSSRRPPHPG
jgi:diguanylate cyclase (GGDEF)-like protein/PAS domain S-box-containing protein